MRTQIIEKLHQIEKGNNIRIFYAVESGSRAWGFASKNSDFDVRFLYYHKPEWYFSIFPQKDSIVQMEDNNLLDFSGWELRKTLSLLLKSNMSLYEWLHSPIVYIQTEPFAKFAELAKEFFNPKALIFSYSHLAEGNYKAYINKEQVKMKKYLYVLRTIAACRWLEQSKTLPPIEIEKLQPAFADEPKIFNFLNNLIESKKNNDELGLIAPQKEINQWIEAQLKHYTEYAAQIYGTT